jgi:anhydro-N-acetylmuramic acid kinase
MKPVKAIGLMSGTSLDGVDVALIETDGARVFRFGPTGYRPYADDERRLLRRALSEATRLTDRIARPGALAAAEALVTKTHAETVERFLDENRIACSDVAIVGFHGQTVLHRPAARLTVQIGDGEKLAERLRVPVVFDFRAADVAAGGEGAPLVPAFHRAIVTMVDRPHPVAVLNLGGVANVTFVDGESSLIACDAGPGNALLDDFMLARTGEPRDGYGAMAARGRVDEDFVAHVLGGAFFALAPPKSLDRNAFTHIDLTAFSVADGAATLSALTAAAVLRLVPHLPRPPQSWIVAGGGASNPTLMAMLAEKLMPASVETANAVGWSSDAIEAQAFAFLAVRSLLGLPISFPSTTGTPRPMTGGVLVRR